MAPIVGAVRERWGVIVGVLAVAAAVVAPLSAGASGGGSGPAYELAHACVTAELPNGQIEASGDGYVVDQGSAPASFRLQPTYPGRFMLLDQDGKLLTAGKDGSISPSAKPSRAAIFRIDHAGAKGLYDVYRSDGGAFARGPGGRLVLKDGLTTAIALHSATGCADFPEAGLNAQGKPHAPLNPDGTVFGFADAHLHITADMRAGGRVIDGKAFSPLGIQRALGGDKRNHGADGSADVTGNLLRTGLPFGTHDTHGWPTFAGWPVHDTNTHQQIYWRWLQRMWMAGERVVVAQTVEDAPICKLEPVRAHSCNEMETIASEVNRLKGLERYTDAQAGGPGKGFFQLVFNPAQARRVASQGKLAVVIGMETSDPLNCSEPSGCTRKDVDRGLRKLKRIGVRSMFIAHWVDNAFGGAALEGGDKGKFISAFEQIETGHYFNTGPCPHPSQGEEVATLSPVEISVLGHFFPAAADLPPMPEYPPGPQCNTKGLTKLGAYLVKRMMAMHMLIDVDHLSERGRDEVLRITAKHDYPLVSSHTGTGGSWTPGELRTLFGNGGFATSTPGDPNSIADKINSFDAYRQKGEFFGIGLGTDTGGFSGLPGAPGPDQQISYPFKGYRSGVSFDRETTGERTFDFNSDGVAHYGLFPDLLAATENAPGGDQAMRTLFRSAEAYLQMWERASG